MTAVEQCRPVDIDGRAVLVRGRGKLTASDCDALGEVIAELDRRFGDRKPLPGVLTIAERKRLRRCHYCEWHVPTMGHNPMCPFLDPAPPIAPAPIVEPGPPPPPPVGWAGGVCSSCGTRVNTYGVVCAYCCSDIRSRPSRPNVTGGVR